MSDGPHRSLPMRKHWKDLAERADKTAYSATDVAEALPIALQKDFREAPFELIKEAHGVGEVASLFQSSTPEQLDALRAACPGSAAGNVLIDCALEAQANGLTGRDACQWATEAALEMYSRSAFRGIEEHYYREAPAHNARYVRSRLDDARRTCDYSGLASKLLDHSGPKPPAESLSKRGGLDEGPEL